MKAILLVPENGAQFHLGETSLDDTSDVLHADTLFSALTNVYAFAFDGAERFIGMIEEGKLCFSSGFYALLYQENPVLFFPKPAIDFPEQRDPKRLKKVRYLSKGVWNALQRGFDPETISTTLNPLNFPSIGSEFVYLENELPVTVGGFEKKAFRQVVTAPKVKVHSTEQEDRIYHETSIQFIDLPYSEGELKGAFYFLLKHTLNEEKPEWQEFLAAVRIMADEGVGGQRSSGRGQFKTVKLIDVDITESRNASWYVGLSPISPFDDHEFHDGIHFYELFVRGGGSLGLRGKPDEHRMQARFAKEGALLHYDIKGSIVDVSPDIDKSVLRYGMNFSIPLGSLP
jgi:CRISPR-associated protein Csm4